MNADEKRKVFEELLEEYQDVISSEFSYEDGEREAERRAWLNKYDGIKEPLIKDKKIRKVIRAWAEVNGVSELFSYEAVSGCPFWYIMAYRDVGGLNLDLWGEFPKELTNDKSYTIAELCGEEEE